MATKPIQSYVNYTIYFGTQTALDAALALITARVAGSPNQAFLSPGNAAKIFNFVDGVNYNIPDGSLNTTAGMIGTAPYFLGLPAPGIGIDNPNPSGLSMDGTKTFVKVPAQIGNADLILNWVATFGLIAQYTLQATIPLRRFIVGFESASGSEGGSSGGVTYSRDSSRTMDGIGWSLRGTINTTYTQQVFTLFSGETTSDSWERVYIRVRNFGSTDIDIWRCGGFPSSSAGFRLWLKPDGSIDIYAVNSSNVQSFLANTGVLFTINEFGRLDIILHYAATSKLTIHFDGNHIIDVTSGAAGDTSHLQTILGTQQALSNTNWEIDFDDWHNAEIPTIQLVVSGVPTLFQVIESPTIIIADGVIYTVYPPVDFVNGTHVKLQKVDSATLGSFSGNAQSLNQGISPTFVNTSNTLTSTTSADSITALTDTDDIDILNPFETVVCMCAMVVGVNYLVAGGTPSHSSLGYILNIATSTQNTTDGTSVGWQLVLWPGTERYLQYPNQAPASITFTKAANTQKVTINALQANTQYVGVFGVEDNSQTLLPRTYITHNAWFPTIADAFIGPSAGPVFAAAVGGTYTGNGTEQSIQIPFPVHFLWIRPVGVNNPGAKWFGASLAAHRGNGSGVLHPDLITRMDYNIPFNPSDTFTFTVVGNNDETNASATVYQYIAFCDPSYQFMLCGAWNHKSTDTADVNNLLDPTFLPVACFYSFDRIDNDLTIRLAYKGAGHSGSTASKVDGTALSNAGLFGIGEILSSTDTETANGSQVNFCAVNATNGCQQTMIQVTSYVGNGGSSQTISLTPATSRYPLLVYVQPHNADGFVCDPSDIAPSSRNITNGISATTGITAVGQDSITVGSTLNSNGIVYEVFVICGDTSGFNNGEFIAVPCTPYSQVPTPGVINNNSIVIIPEGGIELLGAIAPSLLKDVSGIYQLVKGQTHDILLDRQPIQKTLDLPINGKFKTGYIGG